MYKGRTKLLVSIFTIFAMVTIAVMTPMISDESSAGSEVDGTNLTITYNSSDELVVNANGKVSLPVIIMNKYSEQMVVYTSATCSSSFVDIDVSPKYSKIASGGDSTIVLNITADKYAHQGDYTITLSFRVEGLDVGAVYNGTHDISINVESSLSAEDQYNRFMGIWDNDLPSPFDGPWIPAIVTGLVWIVIGMLAGLILVPLILNFIMNKEDEDYEPMKKALTRMCLAIIILNGIAKAIRVLGLSEDIIDRIDRVFYICYILVAVMVLWRIYIIIINWLVKRIGVKDFIPGGSKSDFESLKPLLVYIGEIVFAVVTVGSIMNLLGFNMTAIITSAGIVSLGITMGAQSVLSQFFSGLVILATRPFKAGDMITLNGGSITYRVKRINVMFTEFENWDNTDITIIPNSSLTSGIIKNITRETLKSKVHIFMDVGYGTDLAYARAAMLEVANANPRIIKDGSVSRPSTRVIDFLDSNIRLRLTCYVDDFNDSGVIAGELRQALYNKFNEKGINIDYTQIVLREPSYKDNDNSD